MSTETIVVGTSLTEASDAVVRTAIAVARATGARIWLVHAYTFPILPDLPAVDATLLEDHARELRRQAFEQTVRTGLATLPGHSPEQVRVVLGAPQPEIVRLAREVSADLIVVGAAEGSRFRMLGSTAERVVRKAPCPVLVLRSALAFPPYKVEIPVDLSLASANGLRCGLELLGELGVTLGETEVLFVLNPLELAGSIHFTREQVERFAAEELRRFFTANVPAGTRLPPPRIRTGFARQEILAALDEREVDLAILGTHGRSGLDRLVLGSVAAGVVDQARCNLLIVPTGAVVELEEAAPKGADWEYVADEVVVGGNHPGTDGPQQVS